MDRRFLDNIKQKRNLKDVLRQYRVRYYIASTVNNPPDGYQAEEPFQAGPNSPKMEAYFTGKPCLIFNEADVYTRIYDLESQP
jgi:hypothetical protein